MSKSKVQNVGRLYYVEPNNVYNRMANGIPHPYEDYCISVDLLVEIGDRNSLGPVGRSNSTNEMSFSSDKGTISFIGGTNGFLTTNFTDIQSTNPSQNTNECLGIESINISYESWYVPRVNIRFVDVRGASLMSKQEQGYVETIREEYTTGHQTMKINGGSFFNSLFSFPYPMFKLKVKGFYGKEVTYNLTVEDFQSSFNAENGNFVTDVRFIGYMFGVYTDIPMNYLMISPFIEDVGDVYWNKQCENGRFRYYGGIPMVTYPYLKAKITSLTPSKDAVDNSDSNYGEQKTKIQRKIDSLTEIKGLINDELNAIFDGGYEFCETYEDGELVEDNPYSLIGVTSGDFDEKSKKAYYDYYKDASGLENGLIPGKIVDHNKKYGDSYSTDVFFGINTIKSKKQKIKCGINGEFEKKIGVDNVKFLSKDNGDVRITLDEWISRRIVKNGYVKEQEVTVCFPNIYNGTGRYVIPKWCCELDDIIKKLKLKLEDINEQIKKNRNEKISEKLGFGVSVGNAFNMAFAHMETFMEIYYHYLRQIKTQQDNSARSLDKLRVNIKNTDLPSSFESNDQIPPFTMFYKDVENDGDGVSNINRTTGKKRVVVWPGDLEGVKGNESIMPELEFVNKLIKAAKEYKIKETEAENIVLSNAKAFEESTSDNTFIPTTPFDLSHDNTNNPYAYIPTLSNGNMQWENMMTTFYLRLFYWYSTQKEEPSQKAVESFAKIEAYNMYLANKTIPGSIKDFIKNREDYSEQKFASEMSSYFSESNKPNIKSFDIGRGTNKHLFVPGSSTYTYDWISGIIPFANVPPVYVDPQSVLTEEHTGTCVTILSSGTDGVISESANTYVNEYSKKYESDFLKKLVNKISSSKISDETKVYQNEILPKLETKKVKIGNASRSSYRSREDFYHVSYVNDKFLSGSSCEFPQNIPNGAYINTPSFVINEETYKYPVFGYPKFYTFLDGIEGLDYDDRLKAKACVFAMCVPISYVSGQETETTKLIPFYIALREGAVAYLASDGVSQEVFDAIKTVTDIPSETYVPDKNLCMKIFEDWAITEFEKINNAMEIKRCDLAKLFDEAKSLNSKKIIMKDLFALDKTAIYDKSVYDEKGEVIIRSQNSFDFPARKDSEIQDILLNNCNRYVVFIKLNEFRGGKAEVSSKNFSTASNGFFKGLKSFYENQLSIEDSPTVSEKYDEEKDTDLKISTYLTLKNLYDRWIANMKPQHINRWKLDVDMNDENSDFTHFKFIDAFYRDISRCAPVNFEHISNLSSQMITSTNVNNDATSLKYQGKSLYEFLASICEKNQMMLLCFPMENEFTNPEGIADMFDVKSYSKMDRRDTSCFVCLYANKPSQHLDVKYDNTEYMYKDDGFNLSNAWGEVLESVDLIPQMSDTVVNAYKIPAFGVTYGKQNQSIFKKINVNMQNPQVTEASIAATQFIASMNNEAPNKTAIYGQDLYRIYANYSYTCSVEMMGNAQIMPLTYFQLNNIPLFRGAYLIINIEHNIVAGNMTTKFTGVRMSKYELPLVDNNGMFNDPYISSDSRFGTPKMRSLNIQVDEGFYDFVNNRNSGNNKKYTITVSDLLWSDTAKSQGIDNNPSDAPMTPEECSDTAYTKETAYTEDRIWDNLSTLEHILMDVQKAWTNYCAIHTDEKWSFYDGLLITSGYRCPELNKKIGGTNTSHHKFGCAADIQVCKYNTNNKQPNSKVSGLHNGSVSVSNEYTSVFFEFFVKYLYATGKEWDQIFIEKNSTSKWVHFSYKRPSICPDNEEHRGVVGSITAK